MVVLVVDDVDVDDVDVELLVVVALVVDGAVVVGAVGLEGLLAPGALPTVAAASVQTATDDPPPVASSDAQAPTIDITTPATSTPTTDRRRIPADGTSHLRLGRDITPTGPEHPDANVDRRAATA